MGSLFYYYSYCICITITEYYNVYCVQITPTNVLLTALAIADLLTMVSYLPYAFYFYCLTVPDPSYGHPAGWVVYLLFNIYFTITTHTAAMWLTVALAVFRYVVVCCHQALGMRLCTTQRAKVLENVGGVTKGRGGSGGRTAPGDTFQGVTPEGKK